MFALCSSSHIHLSIGSIVCTSDDRKHFLSIVKYCFVNHTDALILECTGLGLESPDLNLGLGLESPDLNLGLGLGSPDLNLGLGLESPDLNLGLGLESPGLYYMQ